MCYTGQSISPAFKVAEDVTRLGYEVVGVIILWKYEALTTVDCCAGLYAVHTSILVKA